MHLAHATLAAALSSLLCTGPGARAAPAGDPAITRADLSRIPQRPFAHACADATRPHQLRCHAQVLVGPTGAPLAAGPNDGYTPSDIASAYDFPSSGGAGVTVALVDAFDDPNAEADLAVYRAQFGLPACTTANGCFKKVNQSGDASPLPTSDSGWGTEISLDLDAVSAACPSCNILLVEADSDSNDDLAASVDTAASLGASAISNSYGGDESSGDDGSGYQHPGVLITASTGDNGYGVEYPASLANVLAVGGTSLTQSSGQSRGWSEAAWSGAGSGCSTIQAKPSYQTDSACSFRTVADVSAVADPNTGLSIYDTFGSGNTGWEVVGGTSPLLAHGGRHLRPLERHRRLQRVRLREQRRLQRRDHGQQRLLRRQLPLHRRGRLRRAHRHRHPGRRRDRPGHRQRRLGRRLRRRYLYLPARRDAARRDLRQQQLGRRRRLQQQRRGRPRLLGRVPRLRGGGALFGEASSGLSLPGHEQLCFRLEEQSAFRRMAAAMWRRPNDPTIYGNTEIEMGPALALIARLRGEGSRATVTHLVAKSVALALARHPHLNARVRFWGKLERRKTVDFFLQVASDDGQDLSGHRIAAADKLSLRELASSVGEAAKKIRSDDDPKFKQSKGLLRALPWWFLRTFLSIASLLTNELDVDLSGSGMPADLFGAAMITSLGMHGIDEGYAPMTPVARCLMIVLVPAVREKPVVHEGQIVICPMLKLCATFDHRMIDGHSAAVLCREIRGCAAPEQLILAPRAGRAPGRANARRASTLPGRAPRRARRAGRASPSSPAPRRASPATPTSRSAHVEARLRRPPR